MSAFRKRPVVVDATQFLKRGDHSAVDSQWGTWEERSSHRVDCMFTFCAESVPGAVEEHTIKTLEGLMAVTPGDWIITGVKGEHYACKPDIFAETYEAVGV